MSPAINLSPRDLAVLRLLAVTPLTAVLLKQVSTIFPGDPFRDERRVRERMQTLVRSGFVRSFPMAQSSGGVMHYYRLTSRGYKLARPDDTGSAARGTTAEISPHRIQHALATAEIIVHTLISCHLARVRVLQLHGDGELTLEAGEHRQVPDGHFQLEQSGALFNLLLEIDNATEPLDSSRDQSIRNKILGYEAYQDWVLKLWRDGGCQGTRPGFRVVFFVSGVQRGNHILWLARELARNKDRRLIYVATRDAFLGEPRGVTMPLCNDHHGRWVSLVNPQPSATYERSPVRVVPPVAPAGPF